VTAAHPPVAKSRDRLMWIALGVVAAANLVWLVTDRQAPRSESLDVVAYGECRGAVRRGRERSGVRFPTMDLIRISHNGSTGATIRGYFEMPGAMRPTWYVCDVSRGGGAWQVERVVIDP
jgi:hypothetical protein